MILIDTNVLMYAAGAEHPNKASALAVLRSIAAGEVDAAIDAEVLQELLHRYRALRRWSVGKRVYEGARKVFPVVLPVDAATTDRAYELLSKHRTLMARDAVHAAVVQLHGLDGICTFDRDFDRIAGVERIAP